MTNMFAASIFFWALNRLYSAYKIWELTSLKGIEFKGEKAKEMREKAERKRKQRVIWTLCDVEIFEIVYLSHTLGITGKSAPQRLFDLITAVIEAGPEVQCIFQ